jgi:hypothetical protein
VSHSRLLFSLFAGLAAAAAPARAQSWYRSAFQDPANTGQADAAQAGGTARLGPVGIDLSLKAGYEYNDNILLAPQARAGTRATFGARFRAGWRASKIQQLYLSGEFTQRIALTGPGRSSRYLTLTPGSSLRYNLYVKDVRVSAFLNLSELRDPSASLAANNTETYAQSTADTGLQVDLPFRGLTVQLMGLRGQTSSRSLSQPKISTEREVLSSRLLRTFRAGLDGGLDAFLIRQDYSNGTAASSRSVSGGVFANSTLTTMMKLQASVSYDRVAYAGSRSAADAGTGSGLHERLEFTHRVRQNLTYTLRAERSLTEGVTSNYYRVDSLSLLPSFKLGLSLDLQLEAGWQRVRESLANGELGVRRNLGVTLSHSLANDFKGVIRFRQVSKDSNLANRIYRQRVFEFTLDKDL